MPGYAAQALGYNDDTDNDLYAMYKVRTSAPNDQLTQDLAAPAEHKQFMEETTARNPVQGTAAMMAAPGYAVAKALGFAPSGTGEAKTSRASVDEVFAAGEGYTRGLKRWLKKR